jgi:hypothetical protein
MVHNGVVILEGKPPLPEGAVVTVLYRGSPPSVTSPVMRIARSGRAAGPTEATRPDPSRPAVG